nr:DUF2628 domain-containing protein [Variovorax terrae]
MNNTESAQDRPALSETWKKRFALIDKAGGPDWGHVSTLPFQERVTVCFNLWACLFGPFYYLAKGLWKKAIAYAGLCFVLGLANDYVEAEFGAGNFIFGNGAVLLFPIFANMDYFKKVRLGDNGWW